MGDYKAADCSDNLDREYLAPPLQPLRVSSSPPFATFSNPNPRNDAPTAYESEISTLDPAIRWEVLLIGDTKVVRKPILINTSARSLWQTKVKEYLPILPLLS